MGNKTHPDNSFPSYMKGNIMNVTKVYKCKECAHKCKIVSHDRGFHDIDGDPKGNWCEDSKFKTHEYKYSISNVIDYLQYSIYVLTKGIIKIGKGI